MTTPLCKIVDIVFVRFALRDLESQKQYLEHFGMQLAAETKDAIYYKGSGISPFIYAAERTEENRLLSTAYRVAQFSELENLARAFNVDIVENTELGGGHKVLICDPDGMQIEIFQGLELLPTQASTTPILNTGDDKRRQNKLQRIGKGPAEWQLKDGEWEYMLPSNVMRLGHTAINVADAERSIKWYQETLGMLVTDNLLMPDGTCFGAFMRCNQGARAVDHHTINILATMPGNEAFIGTFGHAGYEVKDSIDDLMAGHFHMKTIEKYYHEWGIGRHLLGSQLYDYWRDPQGFTLEHWTDGDLLDASFPTQNVPARDVIMAQYGPLPPNTFGLSMPSEDVDAYRKQHPGLTDIVKQLESD